MLVEAQLMACAEACGICATECESHAANARALPCLLVEGEALGAVLVGRLRPVPRCFALPPTVEADEVAVGKAPARDLGAIEPRQASRSTAGRC